jgi:hypothetical protein
MLKPSELKRAHKMDPLLTRASTLFEPVEQADRYPRNGELSCSILRSRTSLGAENFALGLER